jgi:hypothetical protein
VKHPVPQSRAPPASPMNSRTFGRFLK